MRPTLLGIPAYVLLACSGIYAQTAPESESGRVVQKLLKELDKRPTNKLKRVAKDRNDTVLVSNGVSATMQLRYSDWELEDSSFKGLHAKKSQQPAFHQKNTTYVRVYVAGRFIDWVGLGTPILLRQHNGRLYFVVFDRETDFERIRIRYFVERHGGFHEIDAKSFPRAIAIQNMWLDDAEKALAQDKDVNDRQFQGSLTAKIWRQILDGTEYFERQGGVPSDVLSRFLRTTDPTLPKP